MHDALQTTREYSPTSRDPYSFVDPFGSACLIQMDRRHTGVQLDSAGLRASTVRIPVCMHSCEHAGWSGSVVANPPTGPSWSGSVVEAPRGPRSITSRSIMWLYLISISSLSISTTSSRRLMARNLQFSLSLSSYKFHENRPKPAQIPVSVIVFYKN